MKPYLYEVNNAVSAAALTEWKFESYLDCETYVLPDGCKDFIIEQCVSQGNTWFMSDLSQVSYSVKTVAGSKIQGIRLRPGVQINLNQLSSWLNGNDPIALFEADQLDEFCTETENLTDALGCLASGKHTVLCVATELGVSLRSLQRLVRDGTGQTPHFWFSLARVRSAGRLLMEYENLSEVAFEVGFADQSHMNREMKKWFGRTPNQIKSDSEILNVLFDSGYGD